MRWISLWIVAAALSAGSSLAADKPEERCIAGTAPLECHFVSASFALMLCQAEAELAILKGGGGDSAAQCIASEKAKVTASFRAAIRSLAKNASAVVAIKKHQAKFLTAIDGVNPRAGETEREYRQRQSQMKTDLEEAANAVKVEM